MKNHVFAVTSGPAVVSYTICRPINVCVVSFDMTLFYMPV